MTTVEVWTTKGLVTFYLLFAMHLATRRVRFVGCTPNPGGPWMAQTARELTNDEDGFLTAPVTHVLMDRDTKFSAQFQAILKDAGAKPVLLPASSPNCNAHLERFFRSLKDEALDRMIFFGESALPQRRPRIPGALSRGTKPPGAGPQDHRPRRRGRSRGRPDRLPRTPGRAAELLSSASGLKSRTR